MAQVAPPQISEQLIAQIHAEVTATYGVWKANSTQEQNTASDEMCEKMQSDPAYREYKMARATEIFSGADSNGDGVLDAAEYEAYTQLNNEEAAREGRWYDTREGQCQAMYNLINQVNPDREGATQAEIFQFYGPFFAKWKELKSADGL